MAFLWNGTASRAETPQISMRSVGDPVGRIRELGNIFFLVSCNVLTQARQKALTINTSQNMMRRLCVCLWA